MDPTSFWFMLHNVLRLAGVLVVIVLAVVAMRLAVKARARISVFVGLAGLAGLFIPTALLASDLPYPTALAIYAVPLLGVFVAGYLFLAGAHRRAEKTAQGRRYALVCELLGLAIVAKILHNFYWLIVWDRTGDALDFLWIILPVAFAGAAGGGLLINLPQGRKMIGLLYLLAVPASIIAVYLAAEQVDFRALTRQRAAQVTQAVEAYHAREGRYPDTLQQLPMWQYQTLPGPVIIYGQNWCYQGGADYYRLGYLDRDHWSSPILYGRVYAAQGHSPLKTDICQPAIDAYRTRYPGWDKVLKDYGRPTPTPDLGE